MRFPKTKGYRKRQELAKGISDVYSELSSRANISSIFANDELSELTIDKVRTAYDKKGWTFTLESVTDTFVPAYVREYEKVMLVAGNDYRRNAKAFDRLSESIFLYIFPERLLLHIVKNADYVRPPFATRKKNNTKS
jgi:hypothetical protein